jgi:hypothetical protein
MKTKITYSLLAAAAACSLANAQTTAYTTPVGYVSKTLPANAFSFVGLTVHNPVVSSGVIDAESASSVTDTGVNFSTILTSGATYVLELDNGVIQEVTSWNAQGVLDLPEDITGSVVPSTTTYKLRKASTVSDVFGAANSAGLTATAGDMATADVIYLLGAGGSVTPIYFYDDGSEANWYTADGDLAGDLPIIYSDGFYIGRVAGSSLNLVTSGEIKIKPTSSVITPGWNFLSSVAPIGLTLGTSGLETALTSTDGDYLTVDNVYLPNSDGSFTIAYFYDDGSEAAWYTASGDLASDLSLEAGFLILSRSAGAKTCTLSVPTSYSNL